MNSDRFSKTSRGRYFALSPSEAVAQVKDRSFSVYSYHERLPVCLENCTHISALGHQLASFHRMVRLAMFSLPHEVPRELGRLAGTRAIEEFSLIETGPHLHVREQQFVVYRAFLGPVGRLIIASDIVNAVSRSYLAFDSATQLSRAAESSRRLSVVKSIDLL